MINACIIDDESSARSLLINMLGKYCPDVVIAGVAGSYEEAIDYLIPIMDDIDVVFTDVDLGQNKTGFDILNKLQEFKGDIVFVTAYEEHALRAFRYAAINYLTKPISPNELIETVHRIKRKVSAAIKPETVPNQVLEKLAVYSMGKWELLYVRDIVYIQASGCYSNIHTLQTTRPYTASRPIKYFEEKLSFNKEFVRIQKSFLINEKHICSISTIDYMIRMAGLIEIPIGGGKYRDVMRKLINNK